MLGGVGGLRNIVLAVLEFESKIYTGHCQWATDDRIPRPRTVIRSLNHFKAVNVWAGSNRNSYDWRLKIGTPDLATD